jgi:hypothetical protein
MCSSDFIFSGILELVGLIKEVLFSFIIEPISTNKETCKVLLST